MLSLPRYVLILVLWLSFFFNIERLHINRSELVNIAGPTYILVAILVVLGLLMPQWRPTSLAALLVMAFVFFVVIKVLEGRPFWGEALTYLTLFELAAVLTTAALAHRVGQLTADFVETLRSLLPLGLDGRVHAPQEAEAIVRQQMQYARRRNHPMSLLLVEADTDGSKLKLSTTAQEIERLLTRRLGLVSLTQLLVSNLRGSDLIVDETNQGRWLLMTSEAHRDQASAILHRLNEQTKKNLGVRLKYGIASFPDQGITFEDLVAKAEQELADGQPERTSEGIVATPPLAQEPGVQYSSYSSSRER